MLVTKRNSCRYGLRINKENFVSKFRMSSVNLPEKVRKSAEDALKSLIPSKSRDRYEKCYTNFQNWCQTNNCAEIFNENVLLAYFQQLSLKHTPSSLWVYYSMLRSVIRINKNIDIKSFSKLFAFVKRQNVGHAPKKAKILTNDELKTFLREAPENEFLMCKVVAIFGLFGATRCDEIYNLKTTDVKSEGDVLIVTINKSKTYKPRFFTVIQHDSINYVNIVERYMVLRPPHIQHNHFFVFYNQGKCSTQRIGIHTISSVPKKMATFLKLADVELYTGHSLRRSSATVLANSGGNVTDLKRLGGWRSTAVAESYVEESVEHRIAVARKMVGCESVVEKHCAEKAITQEAVSYVTPCTETITDQLIDCGTSLSENVATDAKINSSNSKSDEKAEHRFINCSNFSVNINYYYGEEN